MKWIPLAAVTLMSLTSVVDANGLYENRPWQFATPHETNTKAYIEDLIKKQKAGYYDQGAFLNKSYNLGCSSDAVTTGNDANNDIVTNVANPVGVGDSDVSATTVGNEAIDGSGNSESQGSQSNSGSDLSSDASGNDIINNGDQTVTADGNDANADNTQDVTDSNLAATTSGNQLCNVTIYD